ncbi:MAG: carboxypeptidase-like regulatory domain-containing protein [Chloroflexota bacterium]|nr:carboxypeptidase-like regulatory domain-containing protein [Chloroflexota bacterium]
MRRLSGRSAAITIVALILVLAACARLPGASSAPVTADAAAQAVLAQQARFTGIEPVDPNLIGQASWYEVVEAGTGWEVTVRIGWGDCPAGCISEHRWTYAVSVEGSVTLLREEGDELLGPTGVRGSVSAGPTCPVVTDPPDPACADRPVAGAVLVITDLDDVEIARVTSGANGEFSVDLPSGAYRLVPQSVDGLMGTAARMDFGVEAEGPPTELLVSYDTGIR